MMRRSLLVIVTALFVVAAACTFRTQDSFKWGVGDNKRRVTFFLKFESRGWITGWLQIREMQYGPVGTPVKSNADTDWSTIATKVRKNMEKGLIEKAKNNRKAREFLGALQDFESNPTNVPRYTIQWSLLSLDIAAIGGLWLTTLVVAMVIQGGLVRRRRLLRVRSNRCIACGYNLTGNVSGVCPECGERI